MKTALTILLAIVALGFSLVLAGLVMFAGPTLYGLRPHAVRSDLERHKVGDLVALGRDGRVTAVVTFDGWYKGRDGKTGWFIAPPQDIEAAEFAVNGALDPQFARSFSVGPRRCSGKISSRKVIRAIEPARASGGFLGRSTCDRKDMDISDVIATSAPAMQHNDLMTHEELATFDSVYNLPRWREYVQMWPTPFAYHRTISLPMAWEANGGPSSAAMYQLTDKVRAFANAQSREGRIDLRVQATDWRPRDFEGQKDAQLPINMEDGLFLIGGLSVRRMDIVILCAAVERLACDSIDASKLFEEIAPLRDSATLEKALAERIPLVDNTLPLRDVLDARALMRTDLIAPTADERRFRVVWYEVNPT